MESPGNRPRRSRRRLAIGALGALVLYALVGFVGVPWIAKAQIVRQARSFLAREASVERVRFNPFTLAGSVQGFRLADRDGETLASFDRLRVDFESAGLFRRAYRFDEIAIERPVVSLRILEDGKLSIADLFEASGPEAPPEAEEGSGMPRLIVDRLRVEGGRIEFSDRSLSPAFSKDLDPLNLDVSDLVTIPGEGGDHTLRIGFGEGTELRWRGRQSLDPLRLTGRVETDGIDLTTPWRYLGASLPIELQRGRADVTLTYDVSRAADERFDVRLSDASVEARDLAIRPRDGAEDWLTIEKIRAEEVRLAWPESSVGVGRVRVEGPRATARVVEDGRLDWVAIFEPVAEAPEVPDPEAVVWTWRVDAVDLVGGAVRFEDRSVEPAVAADVGELTAALESVTSDLGTPFSVEASARVNGTGSVSAHGSLAVEPLTAELDLRLGSLDLLPFRPYFVLLPGASLTSAVAGAEGKVRVEGEPLGFRYEGGASVDGVELLDPGGDRLVAWKELDAAAVRVTGFPMTVRIRKIEVAEPYANLHIDREGILNLTRLRSAAGDVEPAPAAEEEPIDLEVVAVDLGNASVDFADESLFLHYRTRVHSAHAEIRDLSTRGAAPATLAFEGRIDETGHAEATGTMRLADALASTDIEVRFRDVDMNRLTPYSAQFAGYSLESGSLDVDIHYRIVDRRLVGTHDVVAKDLVLGDRVEGAPEASLPLRLAIALLKDKDGRIDLEVPIEGTVDSPEFAFRKVIWQAVKKILLNVAAAPFRAIGRLFGSDDEELELVEFDPGRSGLLPVEQDKLSRIAEEIARRPELVLEVEGRFAAGTDTDALRRRKLEELLESRRVAAGDDAAGGPTLDRILEQLYVERFSSEALEAERAAFTPAGKEGTLDAPAFYESLRAKLLEAQVVTDADLRDLARARGEAIVAGLTASGTLAPSRVSIREPTEAKRRKKGSERIASELSMEAPDR